ncbi:MAG TPA: hypothetical protein DCY10_02595 [Clostridiales bacterium]|nr:hypothetical protein [Clostridiales bacterium]
MCKYTREYFLFTLALAVLIRVNTLVMKNLCNKTIVILHDFGLKHTKRCLCLMQKRKREPYYLVFFRFLLRFDLCIVFFCNFHFIYFFRRATI